MDLPNAGEPGRLRFRLWPGITAVVIQWFLWLVLGRLVPEAALYSFLGAALCGLAVLVWWLFFSRVPPLERWAAVPLIVIVMTFTRWLLLHPSISGASMGYMFPIWAIPVMSLALVTWAVAAGYLSGTWARRAALVAAIFLASGSFALLRTDGVTGEGRSQLAWRWSATAEQQLLTRSKSEPVVPPTAPQETSKETSPPATSAQPAQPPAVQPSAPPVAPAVEIPPAEWPGFRGPHRDAVAEAPAIQTDWSTTKPVELWRRPVGPGWSSFAVGGGRIYTQEQRGDFELVSCYSAASGEPVWTHRDATRFWESNGGAGPRGTPTLHNGRVYALGATGIVNALDAKNGAVRWTRNAAADTGAKVPIWGFSGSPLVVDDLVIVAASGRLAAYEIETGKPRWVRKEGGGSYSSPHLLKIGGQPQVLMMTSTGVTSLDPSKGEVLWSHSWPGSTIVQPAMTLDGGILITTGDAAGGLGTRRLSIAHGPEGWKADETWTTRGLKPYFNDFVVNRGYAFGFDGSILSCIDLQDGARKWKGGRYGHGQMLLLQGQDILLVLSEEGEIALVRAASDQFTELARIPALEGKTWNHPALAGNLLLVRNGQEMAAFRLPLADGSAQHKSE